ncbi:helix-turn-helix domain-containing protein [Parasegetibacter sp. NRK P23]|uniref:helix-turn-helix domain-containing protein n=1 Tax=Parasegetibacter sp. NRK P23 TaxID=2942999 RepID=UPI002043089C|nr:helix-turn-helix transcriptional regulator [Parasegetibacter sp. NRK P23]MCM5527236.1 helix-turn-helix domain-containing protein [Parasegetibacter sp. NRK P23]
MRNSIQKLGKKIKERREILHLLQSQLADLSGISVRTIQLIEQGKANPSLETLLKLSDPLGLNLEFLLKQPIAKSNIK